MLESIKDLGIEEGMEKGWDEGIKTVITNMLKYNFNYENIIKATGVGMNRIREIAKEMNLSMTPVQASSHVS